MSIFSILKALRPGALTMPYGAVALPGSYTFSSGANVRASSEKKENSKLPKKEHPDFVSKEEAQIYAQETLLSIMQDANENIHELGLGKGNPRFSPYPEGYDPNNEKMWAKGLSINGFYIYLEPENVDPTGTGDYVVDFISAPGGMHHIEEFFFDKGEQIDFEVIDENNFKISSAESDRAIQLQRIPGEPIACRYMFISF